MKNKILVCYDILMEKSKGMKLFILVKLLKDDLNERGMRYVYIYMLTLDAMKSWVQVMNFCI